MASLIQELFSAGVLSNVLAIEVEPSAQYSARLKYRSGAVRMTYAFDIGLNPSSVAAVMRDKGFAKFFMSRHNIAVASGGTFLADWWADRLGYNPEHPSRLALAGNFVTEQIGFPVYIKPVDGSMGLNVRKCYSTDDLFSIAAEFNIERVKAAVVERSIALPDYRVVVFEQQIFAAYQRKHATLTGDGHSTVNDLLCRLKSDLSLLGRNVNFNAYDTTLDATMKAHKIQLDTIISAGEEIRIMDVSNLSAGGSAVDLTNEIHPHWRDLAIRIADLFGARMCGIDLACESLTSPSAAYAVLEVSGAPAMNHFAALGEEQARRIRLLYECLLNQDPSVRYSPGGV